MVTSSSIAYYSGNSKRYKLIFYYFLYGLIITLFSLKNNHKVKNRIMKVNCHYRGFTYEGAALAIAIKCMLFRNNVEKFEESTLSLSEGSIYQNYVALGWYLHARHKFKKSKYTYLNTKLNNRLSLIVFDGIGFKASIFNISGDITDKFNEFEIDQSRVCYQGYGRSLWFKSGFNIQTALYEIEKVPYKYKADVYSGLGLANAYSFFDKIETTLELTNLIPLDYRVAYIQGLSFGLEARRTQDARYWDETINSLPFSYIDIVNRMITIVHKAIEKFININDKTFYTIWVDEVRKEIKLAKIPCILDNKQE
ncbi:DUF1702 family protein [Sutcliffiella rhizosphaerae]|uniref:DUF1702 family protein n=1 Tax=Sutcliffiella rhizosphaerae TaxID=2880967 RepID=UPI0021E1645A|nr:DUF1702 family protein [Sutcliffiella rhizosphaerae]